ncbi:MULTISPECIES: FecCD family ABC transporter permease [unclassified Gilliamella]|uniref:FecCD family ABC transporter permease n=1 Tax=unclassified Gilliamella TaxID=2685620 RepID=UPI002A091EBD|nr:iron ABC transporter permease [Gilliamella sp. B3831]MCX8576722.1 iron ABC transporter permease [Gilliamella sp. B3815]MCX8578496.1 iron ABC transporter permease [Gilliamella sp. B2717]MCX8587369.1 iron ABC transporter permease [Gilliamella sp. B3801]MCX8589296.1 iron ABC transporter permease [Gilliamella sp. B3812]MCX8591876.1 iron ABC transporter permease [Gilliamella sp. B3804]MCX8603870.1 iron ABC transporter permease [Gilliamella sp. B3823]MCX8606750.1 iron ABC transporter permease [
MVLSANTGALTFPVSQLLSLSFDDPLMNIWLNIRLPRILLAVIVGMALATSGAVMQGLFRNPLADSGLLGISSGAGLLVGLSVLFPTIFPPIMMLYGKMLAAFLGSLFICFLIYLYSLHAECNLAKMVLLGVAINAIIGAVMGCLSYISDEAQLRQISLWSMGHLGKGSWELVLVATSLIIPALLAILVLSHQLNILQLGDEDAHYLGINVIRLKQYLLVFSAILIGTSVAVSGIIAFVGLVVPHMIRLRIGANHSVLLPASALAGGCLLLSADTLARTVVAPTEIPVGLLTSLIGGPYFLWLILRHK